MYLQKLSLVNFKNFDSKTFEFEEKINCFVGQNGIGKTNILDAIYYLSFAKSYFNPVAVQNIQHHILERHNVINETNYNQLVLIYMTLLNILLTVSLTFQWRDSSI